MGRKGIDQLTDDTLKNADGSYMELKSGDKLVYNPELRHILSSMSKAYSVFEIIEPSPYTKPNDPTYITKWYVRNEDGTENIIENNTKIHIKDMNATYIVEE